VPRLLEVCSFEHGGSKLQATLYCAAAPDFPLLILLKLHMNAG
jgi:hypothetical protein